MIDSVLKGTGNSRFLKSAVPAGISWADALAMLQAGTFPIDFNGINTEGFQQVGTPLNKANLLKDATAAQIGLPPSTTPDGMFRALGNTGELHVWRKTVVYSQPVPEVPGSYTLGTTQQLIVATRNTSNTSRGSGIKGALASNSLSVDLAGNVSLENPETIDILVTGRGNPTETASAVLSGYTYFMIPDSATGNYCDITMPRNTVYFVPSYATYDPASMAYGKQSNFDAAQLVTGVPGSPAIPAGTTATYPVSTNPNAYQEGDDAKEAGYTLGEVKTGKHILSYQHSDLNEIHWEYSSKITVSDDGTVSLVSPSSEDIDGGDYTSVAENLIGKFARPTEDHSDFRTNVIVFFPSDATVTRDTTYGYNAMTISKYQPVTGYAAIPAGTTIEYLGKLGDKARVQVVSYVGTGTYGADNPCSITAGFKIKAAIMMYHYIPSASSLFMISDELSTNYTADIGFSEVNANYSWGKKSADGKTLSWYVTHSAGGQFNYSGYKYYVLCIG